MQRIYISGSKEFCTLDKHVNAPLFKRVFDRTSENCKLEISAAGLYRLFLNGEDITKGFLAPYVSNPDHIVYYDEYEIGDKLKEKGNVLCVLLGNGFNNVVTGGWGFDKAAFRSAPKFYMAVYENGEKTFETGENDGFLVTDSPITFDDVRGGERYDAREEIAGVLTDATMGEKFRLPIVAELQPAGLYKKCEADSVRAFEELSPVKIFESGEWLIFDFGQNNAGVCRLKIDGRSGQVVDVWHTEALTDGQPQFGTISLDASKTEYAQHDRYICKDGLQEYTPKFTYHGFRYACVKGLTKEQATKDALTYVVVHSDIRPRGRFACSEPILNVAQEWILRSDTSNFHYYPTDCPHREKNGWTGDANLSAEQLFYNFSVADSLREWLRNIRAAQIEDGRIPCIIPTAGWKYEGANGPAWDEVLVELPYEIYRFTGDKTVVEENADAMEKYFRFLESKKNADGLICYGMTDWCEAGNMCHYGVTTSLEIIDSLISVDCARKGAELFLAIGREDEAARLTAFADELIVNFRKKHLTKEVKIGCPTQTALSLAIMLGAYKEEELPIAFSELREAVKKADGHFKVGVIGMKYLFDALVKADMLDEAIEMLVKEDFPSFRYMQKNGATTLWEAFVEVEEGGTENFKRILRNPDIPSWAAGLPSLNHHFFGSLSAWFYRALAGIDVVGKRHAILSPKIPSKLTFAEGEFRDEDDFVKARWEKNGDKVLLSVDSNGFEGAIRVDGYLVDGKAELPLSVGKRTYTLTKIL